MKKQSLIITINGEFEVDDDRLYICNELENDKPYITVSIDTQLLNINKSNIVLWHAI